MKLPWNQHTSYPGLHRWMGVRRDRG